MALAPLELLIGLSVIIVLSTFFAVIAKKLKQPALVAFIVAGILIGPAGFGLVTNHADIVVMSELGVAFLLFAIGIESDVHKLLQMRYVIVLGAVLQVFVTAAIIFGLMQWIGLTFIESAYIGLMFAFSSTVIVVKTLISQHKLSTLQGRLMVASCWFRTQ
jgi:CPA2 family monovalent cation:H+ antiporter-2